MNKVRISFLCAIAPLLSACSLPIGDLVKDDPPTDGEKAKAAYQTYISHWEQMRFADMYKQLSSETKKKVTSEVFVSRYQNIYDGIEARNVKIERLFTGDVKPDETQEGANGWYVSWNPSLIFPGMQEGDKVRVYTIAPRRGDIVDRGGRRLATNRVVVDVGTLDQNNRFVRVATLTEDDVRLKQMAKQKGVVLRKRSGTTVDGCHHGRGRAWPWRQRLS